MRKKDVYKYEKLKEEIESLKISAGQHKRGIAEKQRVLADIEKQIAANEKKLQEYIYRGEHALTISEHAIFRYLEREMGIDIEDIKVKLLSDAGYATGQGDGVYPVGNGTVAIRNNNIVTFFKDGQSEE